MRELHTTEASKIHGGLKKAEFIENTSYNRCVAGFTAAEALFGAAIGVGSTWGLGGPAGFGIGTTVGAVTGAYFLRKIAVPIQLWHVLLATGSLACIIARGRATKTVSITFVIALIAMMWLGLVALGG